MIDPALITVGLTAISAVVWTIRQEGRINGHDQLFDERQKLATLRHDEIIKRLERIERKQDDANGKH